MDKGLTWNAQLDEVMNRTYRAFCTYKGTSRKSWGLKPWVAQWVCTMMIRPLITYAAMVWWPRLKLTMSHSKLKILHRLTCLGIIEAMKMATTAATKVHPGFPPLHLKAEAKVLAGIYRLSCNEQWRPQ